MYRSSAINNAMSHYASKRTRRRLAKLGIVHEVDMRSAKECGYGDKHARYRISVSDIPGADYVRYSPDCYDIESARSAMRYAGALGAVMDDVVVGEPVNFRCAVGSDRTGMLACLIEGLLGVGDSDIVKDYELSSLREERLAADARWRGLMTALKAYGHETVSDNAIQWAVCHGISLERIEEFRVAAIDGVPESLQRGACAVGNADATGPTASSS